MLELLLKEAQIESDVPMIGEALLLEGVRYRKDVWLLNEADIEQIATEYHWNRINCIKMKRFVQKQ
jgi:hypothetical protein